MERTDSATPESHTQVIDLFPGLAEFAALIGVKYEAAKAMRRRSSIPDEYRASVVGWCQENGHTSVTFELLTRLASKVRLSA